MGLEQRGRVRWSYLSEQLDNRMTSPDTTDKPFRIDKRRVYEAYKAVKSKKGAAGVDGQTIEQFESDLRGNLYKIWNRMSSGSYFPPPVSTLFSYAFSNGVNFVDDEGNVVFDQAAY